MAEQGVDLEYVAEYIGAPFNGKETVFYAKLPQKRSRFIGIGMALRQPLDTINAWIRDYSNYHRLYVKDITEDLIWIYLIGLNQSISDGRNCFRMYDECHEAALNVYTQMWDEFAHGSADTLVMDAAVRNVNYDDRFDGLREFIVDHIDAFRTAYAKPRRMLHQYLECILDPEGNGKPARTLNSLRGDLDDSMINYLSGQTDTVRKNNQRTVFKAVPKSKKSHIRLCLALGMNADEINTYLTMMGFAPLKTDGDEGRLSEMLRTWEKNRPVLEKYKNIRLGGCDNIELSPDQKRADAQEMIGLRNELQSEYSKQGSVFPYG